ncbi:MAG: hypothetical protein WD317_04385 [Balneolaceae bacterium]
MPKTSKVIGLILILLGLVSFFGTGSEHFTALIPSFFGLVFYGLGYLADRQEDMRKHAMHAALLNALFGIFGTIGGLAAVFRAIGGRPLENPPAAYAQAFMAILCIYFIITGVKSFIDARKNPAA